MNQYLPETRCHIMITVVYETTKPAGDSTGCLIFTKFFGRSKPGCYFILSISFLTPSAGAVAVIPNLFSNLELSKI